MIDDRAGKSYWDATWEDAPAPRVDPESSDWRHYPDRQLAQLVAGHVSPMTHPRLLEVGCANSGWLPFFAQQGYVVSGIDYSSRGCEQARRLLTERDVEGRIVCADFYDPPADMHNAFDVVISYGVAEHFEDTAKCLRAFDAFLAPGGIMITLIPNMRGLPGFAQRATNRAVFDVHVPLTREELRAAHLAVGQDVSWCDYFLPVGPGVINIGHGSGLPWQLKRAVFAGLARLTRPVSALQERRQHPWSSRILSPYVVCVGVRSTHRGELNE